MRRALSLSVVDDAPVRLGIPTMVPIPVGGIPDDVEHPPRRRLAGSWLRTASAPATYAASGRRPDVIPLASPESPSAGKQISETVQADAARVAETSASEAAVEATALTDWRTVPSGAPVLLLSTGQVLGAGMPGPILGPGLSYRITSVTGSVVGLEIMDANGAIRGGYANAVDLRCIEPKIRTGELARGERGKTGGARLARLVTTTFGLFGG